MTITFPTTMLLQTCAELKWKSVEEQMDNLEPTDTPEEVHELQIMNSFTFLQSFTHDPLVGREFLPKDDLP